MIHHGVDFDANVSAVRPPSERFDHAPISAKGEVAVILATCYLH